MTYGVITVTLNAGKTVRKTIDSVLGQSVKPRQYVFVDGGSNDETLRTLEGAMARMSHPTIGIEPTLIRQASQGITAAWNLGIRQIDADLVFILNGDDWYEFQAAARVIQEFERYPQTDVLLASGRYLDPVGIRAPKICRPRPAWVLPVAMTIVHPACFVRRDLYDRIGLFDEMYDIAADYEFIYRCVKRSISIRECDSVMVNVLEGGAASQQRRLARDEVAAIGRKYCAVPSLPAMARLVRLALDR